MPDASSLARIEGTATRHETVHGGRRVVWRRFGNGPALVMLHGGDGDWRHWIRNIEPLSQHRSPWLPDMPGYGESDSLCLDGGSPQAMDRLVDAVVESMRSGGLQDALAGFAGPQLLVWGEHDITAVPQELAPQIAAGCRDAAWRIVEGAGHWVQYERDEKVSALLNEWFTQPG
jgi:pimeloyl-ACP methyl ester carboxylesterase